VRAETTGTLTAKKLECVAAALEVAITGKSTLPTLGPFHVSERPGGLVLTTGTTAPGSGAPEALAQRFEDLLASGSDLVVATSVGTPPFEATVRHRVADDTYDLRIGSEQARQAVALLAPLLARDHDPQLEHVTLTAADDHLSIRLVSTSTLAFELRRKVVETFNTSAQSMSPTLLLGDHFFVVKDLATRAPERGDVIVFEYKEGQNLVKRVVGLPGDHLVIKGDEVTVNGVPVLNVPAGEVVLGDQQDGKPPIRGEGSRETLGGHTFTVLRTAEPPQDETLVVDVASDQVFVLGDNRHNSFDSRRIGPIDFSKIRGRLTVIYWSSAGPHIRWERLLKPVE
jgi:signal peptidase I